MAATGTRAKKSGFRPGEAAPNSGQYREIGPRGGKGKEVTSIKDKTLPPTTKKGKAARSPRKGGSTDTHLSEVTSLFQQLGDPVALKILALSEDEGSVARIGTALAQDSSAIRDHLAVLQDHGLVSLRRQRGQDLYSLTYRGRRVLELVRWLVYAEQPRDEVPVITPVDPVLLEDVRGFVDDPEAWFQTPNVVFEGRRPIELLGTPDEARLRNRILAAKLGMFS
jgi:DNA-binding transcriptional ArsR family regulator